MMRRVLALFGVFAMLLWQAGAVAQTFTGTGTPILGLGSGGQLGYRVGPNTFRPIGTIDPVSQAWRPLLQPPTTSILGGVLAKAAITNQFIMAVNPDGSFSAAQPIFSNIGGTLLASQVPAFTGGFTCSGLTCTLANPTSTALGGVKSGTAPLNQFQTGIDTTGAPTFAQVPFTSLSGQITSGQLPSALTIDGVTLTGTPKTPSLTGYLYGNGGTGWTASATIPTTALSGTLQAANFPALTGDVTTPGGSLATTLATVNANTGPIGGASAVPVITLDGKGRATAASTAPVVAPAGTLSGTTLNPTVVNSSLQTLGTIGTGVWQGTRISLPYMAQAPAGTLRGNLTGGTADVSDSTLTAYIDAAFGNTRGSVLVRGATGWLVRTPTAAGQVATFDGTDTGFAAPGAAVTLFPGLLFGLTLANNGTNPNTQLDIAAGTAASDDAASRMTLASTVSKTLSAWAAGGTSSSPAGALDTGSAAANTWYHVFVIYNPTTLATDVLFSVSLTPTLPSGYTKKRRIGSILTTGTATNITQFVQTGDEFVWVTPITAASGASITAGAQTALVISTPLGVKVKANVGFGVVSPNSGDAFEVYSPDASNTLAAATSLTVVNARTQVANVAVAANGIVLTNTSSQVRLYWNSNATGTYFLGTTGWSDTRGK